MSGTIKQIITGAPIAIRDDDSLALALQVMIWSDVRHLPVLKDGVLVGLAERAGRAQTIRRARASTWRA